MIPDYYLPTLILKIMKMIEKILFEYLNKWFKSTQNLTKF